VAQADELLFRGIQALQGGLVQPGLRQSVSPGFEAERVRERMLGVLAKEDEDFGQLEREKGRVEAGQRLLCQCIPEGGPVGQFVGVHSEKGAIIFKTLLAQLLQEQFVIHGEWSGSQSLLPGPAGVRSGCSRQPGWVSVEGCRYRLPDLSGPAHDSLFQRTSLRYRGQR